MRDSRPLFDDAELEALDIPAEVTPAAWSDEHRVLPAGSPAGDRWRNAHSPALAVLMNLIVRATVLEIWIKKCVQAGVSTMAQNIVGWYADRRPCTALVVLPNKEIGQRQIVKDWRPMFRLCPPLKAKSTGRKSDSKLMLTRLLNAFELHLAYSGSVASLAAMAVLLLVLDEVDKWEGFKGKEANPIDLARMRQTKFLDKGAKLIGLSTPTTSDGNIAVEYDACSIKLQYAVPCPHCGTYQVLHQNYLRWAPPEKGELPASHAERVLFTGAAWFECIHCRDDAGNPTRMHEEDKREMVLAGRWQTPDEAWQIYFDGREIGGQPQGVKIGVKYPAFYDLDISWKHIAAEAIQAGRDVAKQLKLFTQRYAEEFKFQEVAVAANVFAKRCRPDPETGFVPFAAGKLQPWVMRLLLTVDTQLHGFWWVLRGWGYGLRSHRVAHGQFASFEQIEEMLYRSRWAFDEAACRAAGVKRDPLEIYRCGIDSGGGIQKSAAGEIREITERVYRWCQKDPVNRLALKGNSKPMDRLVVPRQGMFQPLDAKKEAFERIFYLVHSEGVRDLLASRIAGVVPVVNKETGEVVEVDQWALNDHDDFEFNQHLAAVKKTRKLRGGKTIIEWGADDGARHDFADDEAYQVALAEGMYLCTSLPTVEQFIEDERIKAAAAAQVKRPSGLVLPSGRPWGQR